MNGCGFQFILNYVLKIFNANNNDSKMIEFIDNEEWCRWNGELMSPENMIKLFGVDIAEVDGNIYYANDFIYIAADTMQEAIIKLLQSKSFTETNHYFEDRLDERHGFAKYNEQTLVELDDNLIDSINRIKLLAESPEAEHWDFMEIQLFFRELNEYYNGQQSS